MNACHKQSKLMSICHSQSMLMIACRRLAICIGNFVTYMIAHEKLLLKILQWMRLKIRGLSNRGRLLIYASVPTAHTYTNMQTRTTDQAEQPPPQTKTTAIPPLRFLKRHLHTLTLVEQAWICTV